MRGLMRYRTPGLLWSVADGTYVHVDGWVCATDGDTVHAVTARHALRWGRPVLSRRRKTWDTVCGSRARPWWLSDDDRRVSIPWPPDVAGLKAMGKRRCRDCHAATGRRKPAVTMEVA